MLFRSGKLYTTSGPTGIDPQLVTLADAVGKFLPSYRADLAQGVTWTDSTSDTTPFQNIQVDRTSISQYTVGGDTTIGGVKALRIRRTTSTTGAGLGSMQGTPVSLESSSKSAGSFFLTTQGVYYGGNHSDDVKLKLTILAQKMEINIAQTSATTIEMIK